VLAHWLLARIALQVGDFAEAQGETEKSFARLRGLQTPVLAYQAHLLEGQIAQARNDPPAARRAYLEARQALEALRSRLQGEELKISFIKNRMQVYEALVICTYPKLERMPLPKKRWPALKPPNPAA